MDGKEAIVPMYIGGGAPLQVTETMSPSGSVLSVRGELDRETTPRLAAALRQAVAGPADRIEIDLSGVTFIDSQGLRILLEAKRRAREGTAVVVVHPSSQVERLLQMTGVAELLGLPS